MSTSASGMAAGYQSRAQATYLCETGRSTEPGNWAAQSRCWGYRILARARTHTRNTRSAPLRLSHWRWRALETLGTRYTTRTTWLLWARPRTWSGARCALPSTEHGYEYVSPGPLSGVVGPPHLTPYPVPPIQLYTAAPSLHRHCYY